jgi:hypothetical protein
MPSRPSSRNTRMGNPSSQESFLHSFIKKILVFEKEHIVYLVTKDKAYLNDEIRNNRKVLSQKPEVGHGDFTRKAGSEIYKINYRIVLI